MSRSVRQQRRDLASSARSEGKTWVEIAETIRERWPSLTPRAAVRIAHGWTQLDVVTAWSKHFRGRTPEAKEISRWEVWPSPSGVRPSFDALDKLARLYECSVSDLLADISDYRHLDAVNQDASRSDRPPAVRVDLAEQLPPLSLQADPVDALSADGLLGVSRGDLTAIRAMSDAFRVADRRLGGGVLYGSVTRYLNAEVAPLLLTPTNDAPDAALFAAAASLTEAAGWMAHDGGGDNQARLHFTRAFKFASIADNDGLVANICASMSHLASQLGEHHHAIRLADKGLHQVRRNRNPAAARLVARLNAMRALALAGSQDTRGCLKSLEHAERSLSAGAESDEGWISHFDEGSLAIETAMCLRRLGDADEAEHHARRAIDLRSGDRVRSRAFAEITLAQVLSDARRIDEAASIGTAVCQVAATLASSRVLHQLDSLMATLAAHRRVGEVAEFEAALDQIHRSNQVHQQPSPWPI